ncbi:dihydroorotase [Candidatus Symbiobacter mobilis]|uniref:Dihydroorotase n=1 Tax=Candidatus Symbiobacter mobilis CR TaxID=946483 RepID=U5N9D9_9BURK|nr:dihydroorotase [Candidatus Symbiobacter mobilis]AGX88181.1 dihydroorotase [Candidatus Symbiobacter mobilis CR]
MCATRSPVPSITIAQPDDWHVHLRDGAMLSAVVPYTARQFARAIVMPNLLPPITTAEQALAYRQRILSAVPAGVAFTPLMTIYLTDRTTAADIARARDAGVVAVKLYPAGATTNSDAGVTALHRVAPALEAMQRLGVPLLVHGEVTDPAVDIFDRESVFLDTVLDPLRKDFPALRVVMEHVTTREAVQYVQSVAQGLAATITAHHLLFHRNALLAGGLRPHYYCLPILKRAEHRDALLAAATGGDRRFFLGTDSAPHPIHRKECAQGCAGCFTAPVAIELYVTAFEAAGALDRLEAFASHHGADFYGLPRNLGALTLHRVAWEPPKRIDTADEGLHPLIPEGGLGWRVANG